MPRTRSTPSSGSSSGPSTRPRDPGEDPGEPGERRAPPHRGGSGTMTVMKGLPVLLLSLSVAAAAERGVGATLEVANRKVFTFHTTIAGSSPEEHVETARARLEQLPMRGPPETVTTHPLQLGQERGTAVMVGSRLIFTVAEGDIDLQGGETTAGVATQAAQVLSDALGAEREQRSVRLLIRSLLLAAVATVIAVGVLILFVR